MIYLLRRYLLGCLQSGYNLSKMIYEGVGMEQVIIASLNPIKIQAVEHGFGQMFSKTDFTFQGVGFESPVSAQPIGDEETLHGAAERARTAQSLHPEADYWVGVEGGVAGNAEAMEAFAWVVVISKERTGSARSAAFYLPPEIARLVAGGMELGHADDLVFGRNNSKQTNGAVGILTNDAIDRKALYAPAVILALIPFVHPELY